MNGSDRQRLRDIEEAQITLYRRLASEPWRYREISGQLVALRAQENEIRGTTDNIDIDHYLSVFIDSKGYIAHKNSGPRKRLSTPKRDAYFKKGRA